MRAYIRSILEETYHVIEAENGAVALTKLSEYNVDFIISDLMMPVMDGLEFSKGKENFNISHIPFLMLTAKHLVKLNFKVTKLESTNIYLSRLTKKCF